MNKPLSNEEIEQAIGPCVILYSDLEKYPTIQNLLPRNGDYVVILVREKKNSGHWVLLYRKGLHHYVYFNSYGYKWDTQMKEVLSKEAIDNLNSQGDELTRLLKEQKVQYNKIKYQGATSEVCGRWVIFIVRMLKDDVTFPKIQSLLKQIKKENGGSFDKNILELTKDIV